MTDKLESLRALLEDMLLADEDITARALVRRSGGIFKNATDITRIQRRRALVEEYAGRQSRIREAIEHSSKRSRRDLERQVANMHAEIERLNGTIDLLVASHRAMYMTVERMGGFTVWRNFFDGYQAAIESLEAVGAVPKAEVVPITSAGRRF